jgi:hypothetical protein
VSVPALRQKQEVTPAGFQPEDLDAAVRSHVAAASTAIRHAESLGKRVEVALANLEKHTLQGSGDLDTALAEANALTTLFDRQSKASLNLVKALDELTRLRSFVAGGPDSRPDLTVRSEIELRAILIQGVQAFGLRVVDKAGHDIIDTEAHPA